ncbi:MAG: PilZ domain-containing protein, partial [Candidatus Omnitrophica bacterium]|nr:PilZ domain-containing protein [Candidatus Omnitrophota bacterium]
MDQAPFGVNHRKFSRVPFKRAVRYAALSAPVFGAQMAHDLSQGGIRINSETFFPVGSRVMVAIQLENEGRIIEVEGRVVWVRSLPYSEA